MSKTVLITGASSGIGRSTAKYFATRGWNVVATMRHPEAEQELTALPGVLVVDLDVQRPATIARALQAGIARFGHLDALVNNAGYGQFGVFEAISDEQARQQFEVNVFGVMNVTRAVLPHFRERGQGTILNVSSGTGRVTLPLISLYAASKFALEGFSEALALELATLHIAVKIIEPGGTDTNFTKAAITAYDPLLPAYNPFMEAAGKMYQALGSEASTPAEEVAAVIYAAATDNTDTLRYAVGNADFQRRMRDLQELPDQVYVQTLRTELGQYLPA
jgi:NAD(P)-dependent dehydrogenase (short-subunit alcohol dehydrogenase family)